MTQSALSHTLLAVMGHSNTPGGRVVAHEWQHHFTHLPCLLKEAFHLHTSTSLKSFANQLNVDQRECRCRKQKHRDTAHSDTVSLHVSLGSKKGFIFWEKYPEGTKFLWNIHWNSQKCSRAQVILDVWWKIHGLFKAEIQFLICSGANMDGAKNTMIGYQGCVMKCQVTEPANNKPGIYSDHLKGCLKKHLAALPLKTLHENSIEKLILKQAANRMITENNTWWDGGHWEVRGESFLPYRKTVSLVWRDESNWCLLKWKTGERSDDDFWVYPKINF